MTASHQVRAIRRSSRLPALLLVLAAGLAGLTGCDEFGSTTGPNGNQLTVEGVWTGSDGGLVLYLEVTSSDMSLFLGTETTCFGRERFTIESQNGDTYTLQAEGEAETFEMILRVEGGQLRVQSVTGDDNLDLLLDPSEEDLSALNECTVEGIWETLDDGLTVYVEITTTTVTIFEGTDATCYGSQTLTIVGRTGDTYTLRDENTGETMDVQVRLEGNQLHVQSFDTADPLDLLFTASDRDLSALDMCTIEGQWVLQTTEFTEYLDITSNTLTIYDEGIDCYYILQFNIIGQNGDVYTLENVAGGDPFDVVLRLEGQQLYAANASDPDNGGYYDPTDQDFSTFQECETAAGGGGDPSINCTDLPLISVGQTINGELTTSDREFQGYYFDLYRLELSVERQVQISATSNDLDNYLYLYAADGTYITEDDDSGGNLDSLIVITLAPGCYRIEATSFSSGITGPYTLSVN